MRCFRRLIAIAVMGLCGLAFSQDHQNVEIVGSVGLGIEPNDLEIRDGYAFLAAGDNGLAVADVSDPATPVFAGQCWFPGYAHRIKISGNYAYLAELDSGIAVCDIRDPRHPAFVGAYPDVGWCEDVEINGQFAYLTRGQSGLPPILTVLDISDPRNPLPVTQLDSLGDILELAIGNGFLYASVQASNDHPAELLVFSLADPAHPVLVNCLATGSFVCDVVVNENFLYTGCVCTPACIYDLQDPAHPADTGARLNIAPVGEIKVANQRLYIAVANDECSPMSIYDVHDPRNPSYLGSYGSSAGIMCLDVVGDFAYIGPFACYMTVLDVYDASAPSRIATWRTGYPVNDLLVSGNLVYTYSKSHGEYLIMMMDVSDPSDPRPVGSFGMGNTPMGSIALKDHYLFVSCGDSDLSVVDVANPAAPSEIGRMRFSWSPLWLSQEGDYLYVSGRPTSFAALNISDPAHPSQTEEISGSEVLASNSHYLFATIDSPYYMRCAYDISDPAHPRLARRYWEAVNVGYCIGVSDSLLLDARDDSLFVYRIGVNARLTSFGQIQVGDDILRVSASGHYALLGAGRRGLRIIDLSDSTNIHEVGYYDTRGSANGATVAGNIIYVADNNNLGIYDWTQALPVDRRVVPTVSDFGITECYPNPFNSSLRIAVTGATGKDFELSLHNLLGQKVATIHRGPVAEGEVHFQAPASLSSGTYYLRAADHTRSAGHRVTLLK